MIIQNNIYDLFSRDLYAEELFGKLGGPGAPPGALNPFRPEEFAFTNTLQPLVQ